MKISAIKQQVKNTERVSVFVDGKYEFSLSLVELLQLKLKNGDELTKADLKKLKKISADGKLKLRAMEWLLNRPHSTREFRDYMYRKKAEPQLTDSLIKDFSGRGYLDDKKFGEWFVDLQKRRNKSNRAIRSELFAKGLDRELIDELMGDHEGDEMARLKKLVAKKRQSTRYKNDELRLAKYLTSQGFSYSQVREALRIDSTD
jgi:regulatory protein